MHDSIFGQNTYLSEVVKPEWNPHELTITDMQRTALLKGMISAYESMLQELRLVKNPTRQTKLTMQKLEKVLQEIKDEYE